MRHVGQVRNEAKGALGPPGDGVGPEAVGMVAVTEVVLMMKVAINMHVMLYHLQNHHYVFSSRTGGLICSNVGSTELGGRKP